MKAQKFSPKTLILINIDPKRAAIVKEEAFLRSNKYKSLVCHDRGSLVHMLRSKLHRKMADGFNS